MDPNNPNAAAAAALDPTLVSSFTAPKCDFMNAECIELNTLNQLGSKNRESHRNFGAEFVLNPDGTPLLDHMNNPITIATMLATKPLKSELASRPGPGNKRLTYVSGDSVTRTLNDIFGFDGWCLEIKSTTREECFQDDKGRFHVTYTAFVRVTHRRSGAFKEDCGSGDAIDKVMGIAISHALKASVTDAMKRAVRHFGDKLGNSLYQDAFNINKAPLTLKDALDLYQVERANTKFGHKNDQGANIEAPLCSITTGSAIPNNAQHIGVNNYTAIVKQSLPSSATVPIAATSSAIHTGKTSTTSHVSIAATSMPTNPSARSGIVSSVGQKENVQLLGNNSTAPAQVQNQNVGLPRFRQQSTVNTELPLSDNPQKSYAAKLPPTSLQQIQESSSLPSILNEAMVNNGYNGVTPTAAQSSLSGLVEQTKINPGRPEMQSLDASTRVRLSLPLSFSKESESMNKKRGVLQKDEAEYNSSGQSKRLNPYNSMKTSTDASS